MLTFQAGDDVTLFHQLTDTTGGELAQAGNTGWCSATADANAVLSVDNWVEGDYEAVAMAQGAGPSHGCSEQLARMGRFTAIFQKSHYDSIRGKWVYYKNSALCNGKCQPSEWCSNDEYNWLYVKGIWGSVPIGTYCQPVPPYPRPSATQPTCDQPWGLNIFTPSNNDC